MEEILIAIAQFLFEFLFDVLLNIPFDWPSRNRKSPEPESIILICFLWFIGSIGLGFISILIFKNTLITHPSLRIANLFMAPITSAYISKSIAARRAKRNPYLVPRNHYWQAFWFTLGYTLYRFAYASHT